MRSTSKDKIKSNICYWCGSLATSKEHVPPMCLFPKNNKKSLITVPSCKAHNSDLKSVDSAMKPLLMMGGANELAINQAKDAFKQHTKPTKTALKFRERCKLVKLPSGPRLVHFPDPKIVDIFSMKVFAGLYYHHTKIPANNLNLYYKWDVPDRYARERHELLNKIERGEVFLKDGDCHNPDVFSYKYANTPEKSHEKMFLIWCRFYDNFEIAGYLTPAEHANS